MNIATFSLIGTLIVALPLLLGGHLWFMAQYSAAGIPLAIGAWMAARMRRGQAHKATAVLLLGVSFPIAIWLGQLPGSVAWVRLVGPPDGQGLVLNDVNAESFYVGLAIAGVLSAAVVALALRWQTGSAKWTSFVVAALAVCLALAVVYAGIRPGAADGDLVQSMALGVWLGVLSLQWSLGLQRGAVA